MNSDSWARGQLSNLEGGSVAGELAEELHLQERQTIMARYPSITAKEKR